MSIHYELVHSLDNFPIIYCYVNQANYWEKQFDQYLLWSFKETEEKQIIYCKEVYITDYLMGNREVWTWSHDRWYCNTSYMY